MSESYAKLFSTITASTIWGESLATRCVWITMLAIADRGGVVQASVPGLARIANVTLAECEAALAILLAPDAYSRTPDNEGRRIAVVDGGWALLNHAKYRKKLDAEDRRERKRAWMAEHRANLKPPTDDAVDPDDHIGPQPSTGGPQTQECGPSGHITDAATPTPRASSVGEAFSLPAARESEVGQEPDSDLPLSTRIAVALNRAGCRCTSMNPQIIDAGNEGVSVAHVMEMHALYPDEGAGYIVKAARREHAKRGTAGTFPPQELRATGTGPPPSLSKTGAAFMALNLAADQLDNAHATHPRNLVSLVHSTRTLPAADAEP